MLRNWAELDGPARRFLAASAVSFLGDGLRYAALPLLAARQGAGPAEFGVLLGAATLPFLVLGIFGGVLADRVRRRGLLLVCDGLRLAVLTVFVGCLVTGHAGLPLLYAVAFLMGLLESLATSAAFAYLPTLVPGHQLERANATLSTALLLGRQLLGPLAGAGLLGLGESLPFVVDAASFLLSGALLATVAAGLEDKPERRKGGGPAAVFADVRVSTRWMRVTPHVLVIACSAGVINLFNSGALAVQPYFAEHVLSGSAYAYGLMMASSALGGVAGAQAAGALATRLSSGRMVVVALAALGAGFGTVALLAHPLAVYAGLALTGVGFAVWGVATTSWRQRLTPHDLMGRADALHRMISWGVNPIGSLLGGLVAAHWGAHGPFLLVAVAPLLLIPLFWNRRADPAPGEPETGERSLAADTTRS
ncbi:MFS transporter [Streptomyces filamentosus]|uniref:MFS transporter n=1 Tax=Streptomyces filamentosus TaxID=67294 RepID=UPI0037D74E3C